jgi:hypothetical protein
MHGFHPPTFLISLDPFNPGNPSGWGQVSFGILNVPDPVHHLRCLFVFPTANR